MGEMREISCIIKILNKIIYKYYVITRYSKLNQWVK